MEEKEYSIKTKPMENESFYDYRDRITVNKNNYNLTWKDIKYLCEKYFNQKLSDNWRKYFYHHREKEMIKSDDKVKVLIMNDIHIPYHRDDIFDEISKHQDIDYLLIAGDLIDCESCSSFDSFNRPSVEEELVLAHEFISKVNTIINPKRTKIIAIRGNHEYRYTRDIMKMQQKELQKMLNPDLLAMLEDGFTYYNKGKKVKYKPIENFQYVNDWFVKLFDNLIIAHQYNFSVVQGRVAEQSAAYFLNQGIAERDDILIITHTHKMGMYSNNRSQGLVTIENGCMCKPMEYASNGNVNYTPQNNCYTYLEFTEGNKIDINDLKVIHLK